MQDWWSSRHWLRNHAVFAPIGIFLATLWLTFNGNPIRDTADRDLILAADLVPLVAVGYAGCAAILDLLARVAWYLIKRIGSGLLRFIVRMVTKMVFWTMEAIGQDLTKWVKEAIALEMAKRASKEEPTQQEVPAYFMELLRDSAKSGESLEQVIARLERQAEASE